MSKWTKIPYEVGKKTVGAVRKMNVKKTANAAMNVGTGVAIASMLPLSTTPSTDQDIERIKQYQPPRRGDGNRENR
jgi:hypothetical protein